MVPQFFHWLFEFSSHASSSLILVSDKFAKLFLNSMTIKSISIAILSVFIVAGLLIELTGCRGNNQPEGKSGQGEVASSANAAEELSPELKSGQEIYKKYCLSCHQAKGTGVSGMYPPLMGNAQLKVSTDTLIYTLLKGKAGKVVVNGNEYAGIMAPHNFLSDEQIANVLNYILNGMNKFNMQVKVEEVSAIRARVK